MATNGNANAIPFFMLRRRASFIPPAIKEAMILWYDISRQGCTNENMAANSMLRDLSGNGHDATCYNFAWTAESGISTTNYPNALVSDGVDDYACTINDIQVLDDYTVIVRRSMTNEKNTSDSYIAWKSSSVYTDAAFMIDNNLFHQGYFEGGVMRTNTVSFGQYNHIPRSHIPTTDTIIVSTPDYYMAGGEKEMMNRGVVSDNSRPVTLFKSRISATAHHACALYSFLLFNRTLTAEEIEWVKKNMVEGDLVLPSQELDPSLIDAWIFSGHTNDEAPSQIVGENGIALTCYNFAWNEEGSGFKDGVLCFDGVDDYCVAGNKLTCDRNVTVIGKRRLTSAEYHLWQTSLNIHTYGDRPYILYLDYYPHLPESTNGHKLKCVFGDYEYNYDNDTEPHSFWATKDAFNGQAYTNKVFDFEDGLKYNYNIYLGRVWSGAAAPCEWYYFAIYDKVMTQKEAQAEIEKLEKIWSNRLNNN